MDFSTVELPEEVTMTLYTTICVAHEYDHNIGDVSTTPYNELEYSNETNKYVLLHSAEISYKIPKIELDLRGEMLTGLQKRKNDMLVRHHDELQTVDGEIQQLLAIEHNPNKGL